MTYIITAEVETESEMNIGADPSKVDARILSRRPGFIVFDVEGKHGEERQRTLALCKSLIDAGFVAFDISHSF